MRFRAKAVDHSFIRTFAQLLAALSRSSRNFILRITPEKLIFALSDKEADKASSAVSIWGEVPKDPYFAEYNMEGVSEQFNEIYLEIFPEKVAGCMSTLRSSSNSVGSLKIKLTKKFVACLTFEIEFLGESLSSTCTHDVPVRLLSKKMWEHYQEPFIPSFDISIAAPEAKSFRLALERMRHLGQRVHFSARTDGMLILSAGRYNVKCSVKFTDLRIYDIGSDDDGGANDVQESEAEQDPARVREFSVNVDTKTTVNIIASELNKPDNFIVSMADDQRLHFYLLFGDISLQYSIPSTGATD